MSVQEDGATTVRSVTHSVPHPRTTPRAHKHTLAHFWQHSSCVMAETGCPLTVPLTGFQSMLL
jgi:hypothetical protein